MNGKTGGILSGALAGDGILPSLIVAVLLALFCLRDIMLWRKVKIKTLKTSAEIISASIGLVLSAVVAWYFQEYALHPLIFVLGVVLSIANVWKNGLTDEVVILSTKRNSAVKWNDFHHVEISSTDRIKIGFYSDLDVLVTTQYFPLDDKDRIMQVLSENAVTVVES